MNFECVGVLGVLGVLEYSGPTGLTILAPAGSFWALPNLYTEGTTCPCTCFEQTE